MVNWCKRGFVIGLLIMSFQVFPELTESIRRCFIPAFSWTALMLQTLIFLVEVLLKRALNNPILLFAVGIVVLLFIHRLRARKRERKSESGRHALQRRKGKGWTTIKEFYHAVEQTYLQGYPTGTYRLMRLGADGRFRNQVWVMRWHGRGSGGLRIYG